MILVRDVTLHIEDTMEEQEALRKALIKRLRALPREILSFRILRESVDARIKDDIFFSYQLLVNLVDED